MSESKPWDFHAHLTHEALVAVAGLIAQGRSDALIRHNEEIGDDSWTLGCSAFQFARFQIKKAAGASGFEWLAIIDPTKQFIFQIGDVPVRFYKGDADQPSDRTLRQTFSELNQLAFTFGDEKGAGLAYRFAVETDFDGAITSIKRSACAVRAAFLSGTCLTPRPSRCRRPRRRPRASICPSRRCGFRAPTRSPKPSRLSPMKVIVRRTHDRRRP